LPLARPLGAPARAPWNRQTLLPLSAGAWHCRRDLFDLAEQRGAWRRRSTGLITWDGLVWVFMVASMLDVADDGLATVVDGDMLSCLDGRLAARAVSLERLQLRGKGARQLLAPRRGIECAGNFNNLDQNGSLNRLARYRGFVQAVIR